MQTLLGASIHRKTTLDGVDMNIKTWAERAESLSDDTVVTSLHLAQFKQDEIDELRAENVRLKANIETRKSNYNRLKAMVGDGSISDRTFSLCEELEKENARLRGALADMVDAVTGVDQISAVNAARAALGEK